jgi:hypothetical protein
MKLECIWPRLSTQVILADGDTGIWSDITLANGATVVLE